MTHLGHLLTAAPAPGARGAAGARTVERLFRAGQPLFFQGDAARHVFELRAGVLRQTYLLVSGERQVTGFHFPGDLVGLSPEALHRTGCTAITDGRALIHRAEALASPTGDTGLQHRLLSAAVRQVALAQDQLVMMGRKSAFAKVEAFLHYLVNRNGAPRTGSGPLDVEIPMSRTDIADFLGLAVETVSRAFTDLRNAGVIAMEDPHRVTILRPLPAAGMQ